MIGRKLTIKEFIKKAEKTHGDNYDYSLVDYKNNKTKVKIICKEHGIFEQTPSNHLMGHGCVKCRNEKFKYSNEDFIKKSQETHGCNVFDYSLVDYKNNKTKVKLICKKHGLFEQNPTNHLRGHKCPHCGGNARVTNEEFIEKAHKTHGNRYNYSLVDYKANCKKIKIVCSEHGIFEQIPSDHLSGKGCAECKSEKIGKDYPTQLYVLRFHNPDENFIKVGISYDTNERILDFKSSCTDTYTIDILRTETFPREEAYQKEHFLLKEFEKYKYIPRYLKDGKTECLSTEALPLLETKLNEILEAQI